MQIYLDTARISDWSPRAGWPRIAGATTNPTLVRQAGLQTRLADLQSLVEAAAEQKLPALMLQLPSPEPAQVLDWAEALLNTSAGRVELTFKLPCEPAWQAALKALKKLPAPVLLTALANPVQLLWARDHGADYVAPYLGRLAEAGRDIWPLVEACVAVQRDGGPALLAASIRNADMLSGLIARGAAAATVNPSLLDALARDEFTEAAVASFGGLTEISSATWS
ncbi:MAG: Fructose-6-phosphate aldolase 1 [Pseudomonadota bacterium]